MPRSLRAAIFVSLLPIAACAAPTAPPGTSAGGEPTAAAIVRAAPDRAAAAGSARVATILVFEGPEGPVELRSSGAFADERTIMTTDLASMLAALPADARGPLPDGFDEPAQTIYADDTIYLRMPLLEPLVGTSGWLSATAVDRARAPTLLAAAGPVHPLRVLEPLRRATGRVEEVEQEELRGVRTTRYRAAVDGRPLDVWIDRRGRPRRLRTAITDIGRRLDDHGPVTLVVELYDYGEPIEITVPEPSEVTPLAEVVPG